MTKITYRQYLTDWQTKLTANHIDPTYAVFLMQEITKMNYTKLVLSYNKNVDDQYQEKLDAAKTVSLNAVPPQYILGYAYFNEQKYNVNQATLIPRMETAQILEILQSELNYDFNGDIIDIGTGSGVIAIEAKKLFPKASVIGTDISAAVLEVAQSNATKFNVDVTFLLGDKFKPVQDQKFDVILSNPPYIKFDEVDLMDQGTKEYEPSSALFAEENGLAFYKYFARHLNQMLKPDGIMIVEFGINQANDVLQVLGNSTDMLIEKSEIIKDYTGRDRFLIIKRGNDDENGIN